MPNLTTQGSAPYKAALAEAARIPRSPLSPQKLSKLANALGVSAPLPASGSPAATSRSSSLGRMVRMPKENRSSPDLFSATLTPSDAGLSASRYFIHIIPPKHFPHESRKDPEAFAAFRRGSLVPVHATLQSQLGAIAREYQLPATNGVVLYLVADTDAEGSRSLLGKGPRISEDVWKWLWMKISDERPSGRVGLGLTSGSSTPGATGKSLLRKLSSSSKLNRDSDKTTPLSLTSPALPSTLPGPAPEPKDANDDSPLEQSVSSQFSSSSTLSATDTPATSSFDLDPRLLPGLGSPSAIPVLARVEFDIDRKVGSWYEKWSRSRKIQQRRRKKDKEGGRLPLQITVNDRKAPVGSSSSSSSEAEDTGYDRLSDSEPEEQSTARVSRRGDPLADVFGTDGETWSDAQSARPNRKKKDDLALSGADLTALPSAGGDSSGAVSDKEEIMDLWAERGQPQLDGSSLHPTRKPVPPPLKMMPSGSNIEVSAATPSPFTPGYDSDSIGLPYLDGQDPKRLGAIYDKLELDFAEDVSILFSIAFCSKLIKNNSLT